MCTISASAHQPPFQQIFQFRIGHEIAHFVNNIESRRKKRHSHKSKSNSKTSLIADFSFSDQFSYDDRVWSTTSAQQTIWNFCNSLDFQILSPKNYHFCGADEKKSSHREKFFEFRFGGEIPSFNGKRVEISEIICGSECGQRRRNSGIFEWLNTWAMKCFCDWF